MNHFKAWVDGCYLLIAELNDFRPRSIGRIYSLGPFVRRFHLGAERIVMFRCCSRDGRRCSRPIYRPIYGRREILSRFFLLDDSKRHIDNVCLHLHLTGNEHFVLRKLIILDFGGRLYGFVLIGEIPPGHSIFGNLLAIIIVVLDLDAFYYGVDVHDRGVEEIGADHRGPLRRVFPLERKH